MLQLSIGLKSILVCTLVYLLGFVFFNIRTEPYIFLNLVLLLYICIKLES